MSKSSKRGNGEGAIYQRQSDGRWVGALTLPNGKRKSLYGKTRREVVEKLKSAQRDQDDGLDLDAGKITVADFLTRWLSDVVKPKAAPKTHSSYAETVRVHLIPEI